MPIYEEITIHKPLFSTNVCIRKETIDRAIDLGRKLKITIDEGQEKKVGIHDPKCWKEDGKKIQRVFNFPDRPMILYCNFLKPMTQQEIADYEDMEFQRNL